MKNESNSQKGGEENVSVDTGRCVDFDPQ